MQNSKFLEDDLIDRGIISKQQLIEILSIKDEERKLLTRVILEKKYIYHLTITMNACKDLRNLR